MAQHIRLSGIVHTGVGRIGKAQQRLEPIRAQGIKIKLHRLKARFVDLPAPVLGQVKINLRERNLLWRTAGNAFFNRLFNMRRRVRHAADGEYIAGDFLPHI